MPLPRRGTLIAPDKAFVHRVSVQEADIDWQGHTSNVVFVQWLTDAASAHSESIGMTRNGSEHFTDLMWVIRKHELEYYSFAGLGDKLTIVTWIDSVRGATADRCSIFRRDGDDKLMVQAVTTWAMIDTKRSRPVRVPKDMLAPYGYDPNRPPSALPR